MPILDAVETPDPIPRASSAGASDAPQATPFLRPPDGFWAIGERLTWLSALILSLSTFMDWYAGRDAGAGAYTLSVIGWHTGALGKLVFLVGLLVLGLVALREAGIELPARVPEGLVIVALGSLATIFVLIRLISIPDQFLPANGRGIGIYISLIAALATIVAGLLRHAEEL
jgi:hypothetical protein